MKPKVVILHDWLVGYRGGERVLEALCEMFPDAPIYTLIHKPGSTSPIIESREIITSFLNKIPNAHKHYNKLLPLMPLAVDLFKIKHDCNLIISSSHCVIKGLKKPKASRHVCYIHTPMRYIYDQFGNYFNEKPLPIKIAGHFFRPYLKWWDKKSNDNVNLFLPNSHFVEKRIKKFYGDEIKTKVVHPFVDLKDFKSHQENPPEKEDFYLMVTAFAPNKRVDIAINAFNRLQLPLKIIGSGNKYEEQRLKNLAKPNIEFLGHLSREEVVQHYFKAKAFIFPGVEDFGIAPLESMASGTPIVAYRVGGALETMNDDTTSFFDEPTADSLINALKKLDLNDTSAMYKRADHFSKDNFLANILEVISP